MYSIISRVVTKVGLELVHVNIQPVHKLGYIRVSSNTCPTSPMDTSSAIISPFLSVFHFLFVKYLPSFLELRSISKLSLAFFFATMLSASILAVICISNLVNIVEAEQKSDSMQCNTLYGVYPGRATMIK